MLITKKEWLSNAWHSVQSEKPDNKDDNVRKIVYDTVQMHRKLCIIFIILSFT